MAGYSLNGRCARTTPQVPSNRRPIASAVRRRIRSRRLSRIFETFLKALDPFRQPLAEIRQLFRSEYENRHGQNHQQMGRLQKSLDHEMPPGFRSFLVWSQGEPLPKCGSGPAQPARGERTSSERPKFDYPMNPGAAVT